MARDIEVLVKLLADTKDINRGVKSIDGRMASFSRTVKGLGAGLGLAIGAKEVVDYLGDAIGAASDFNEQADKVGVVFGDSAREARRWAADLDTAYGISERGALTYIGTLGQMTKAMGLSEERALDLSSGLVELAGDVSAFNNVKVEDVFGAFRSGITGEFEPLKRLGVVLNQARLQAEALKRGLDFGSLNAGDKAQLIADIIEGDLSDAVGNAQDTSDTLAGSQRRLDAAFDNLSVTLGRFFIPVATDAANAIVGLVEGIEDLLSLIPEDVVTDLVDNLALGLETAATGGLNILVEPYRILQAEIEATAAATGVAVDDIKAAIRDAGGLEDLGFQGVLAQLRAWREDPEWGKSVETVDAWAGDVEAELRQGFMDISETVGDLRKYDIAGALEEAVGTADVQLVDFDFGSPKEWVKNINKQLKAANVELREFLTNPKAKASLEAGVRTMEKRLKTLLNLTTKTADLDTAGANLMTVFGASVLAKTNKAKAGVSDAMTKLGLTATKPFLDAFKPTAAEWSAAFPSSTSVRAAFINIGLAARTGFLQGFRTGGSVVPTSGGSTGGLAAPVSIYISGDPNIVEASVMRALRTATSDGAYASDRLHRGL